MANRPGVMFYFDLIPALEMMDDADAGRIFKAALEYAKCGTLPELCGMAAVAWAFIQPKIDRDGESYQESVIDKKYAAYCSHLKAGQTRLERDEWYEQIYLQTPALASKCQQVQPTTSTATTATPTPPVSRTPIPAITTAETPAPNPTATAPGEGDGGGESTPPRLAAQMSDEDFERERAKRIQELKSATFSL